MFQRPGAVIALLLVLQVCVPGLAKAASANASANVRQQESRMDMEKLERFGVLLQHAGQKLGTGATLTVQDEVVLAVGKLSQDVMADREISAAEAKQMLGQVKGALCGPVPMHAVHCDEVAHDAQVIESAYADPGEPPSDMVPSALRLTTAVASWIDGQAAAGR